MSIEIPLTRGYTAVVDDIDADLTKTKWVACPQRDRIVVYAQRGIYLPSGKKTTELLHRVILARILLRPLNPVELVDHIDGDGLNNSRSNLRVCTRSENQHNRRRSKRNTSGYKGVWKKRSRWIASIWYDNKPHRLGLFDTPQEAYRAYCSEAIRVFGEFARID